MGKNRGFKPQGMINPLAMARKVLPTGPTVQERLNRSSRPTWDDLRKLAHNKEKGSTEFLEQWENENFQEELAAFRHVKRSAQEKEHLRVIKKEAKKRSKRRSPSSESDETSSSSSSPSEEEKKSKKRRKKREKSKKKKAKKVTSNHLKLSEFMKSSQEDG